MSICQDHYIQIIPNMSEQKIHYCFTLSEEQMKFLRSKKYKIDRMDCFMSLVTLAERETKLVQVSKTQQVEILRGQFMVDNTQLAKLWDKDRKTVPKLLETMESLGISSSQKEGENRIHTLHCLSGWYVDAKFQGNPYAMKRNADGSGIFHTEVPPVRVITIEADEDPNDSKNNAKDYQVADGKSSSDTNEGKTAPVSDSASLPSSQSNDGVADGKIAADADSSASPSSPSSPRPDCDRNSDDIPSSSVDADGKPNEGKGKENENATQQSGGQAVQPNGSSLGSSNPNVNNTPHGDHQ